MSEYTERAADLFVEGRNQGAAAERARLEPVLRRAEEALRSAAGYFGPPRGRIPECAEDAHAQELVAALAALAAAREEGSRG